MSYNYFYGAEADQFSFYRIPKAFFTDPRFTGISAEAKLLYSLLLDRMSLLMRNGWHDDDGRIFIVFPIKEIVATLGCAHQKAQKLLFELEQKCGLIERKRQGLCKPNIIYVKNFVDVPDSAFQKTEIHASGDMKISFCEISKSAPNKTYKNNTDFSDTESYPINPPQDTDGIGNDEDTRELYKSLIAENICFETLLQENPYDKQMLEEILELLTDTVCTKRKTLRIAGDEKSAEVVRGRLLSLNDEHIRYCLDCLKENTSKIRNIRQYLLAALYNATLTMSAYYTAKVRHNMEMDLE